MDPTTTLKTLTIVDSLKRKRDKVAELVLQWRASELKRINPHMSLEQWKLVYPDNLSRLPTQTDSTSCGVFSAMSLHHYVTFGSLPTVDDWTQKEVPALRLFMLHEIMRFADLQALGEEDHSASTSTLLDHDTAIAENCPPKIPIDLTYDD